MEVLLTGAVVLRFRAAGHVSGAFSPGRRGMASKAVMRLVWALRRALDKLAATPGSRFPGVPDGPAEKALAAYTRDHLQKPGIEEAD